MKNRLLIERDARAGFSVVELLVVLGIVAVLSAISLPYIVNYKKLYRSEDQAIKVMDLMRETAQLALTRSRTYRLEIDLTDNAIIVIDENNTAADTMVKKVPLELPKDVRVDVLPATLAIPNPPNYPIIAFATDTVGHLRGTTTVTGHKVWAAKFKSDGSVVNNSNIVINGTVCIFPPVSPGSTTARATPEVRGITLSGAAGAIRYWKYTGTAWAPYQ